MGDEVCHKDQFSKCSRKTTSKTQVDSQNHLAKGFDTYDVGGADATISVFLLACFLVKTERVAE